MVGYIALEITTENINKQSIMTFSETFKLGEKLKVNRMGYGAMQITGAKIQGMPENPHQIKKLLQRAIELGVTFIDTADQYGPFTSEQLISEALYPYNDDLVIGTKGSLVRFGPHADINNDATPQHLHEALNGSLERLKLDRIELYQLHRIDPNVPAKISFEFLQGAQEDGKINHIGLSEVSVDEIKQAQKYFEVASVQNRYNVMNRGHESVLDYCKQQGITFIPWFPLGGGTETKGKEILERIADRKGATSRQIALSWLLQHANNILIIPGTSSIAHLEENMKAASIELTKKDLETLDGIDQ